MSKPNRKKKGRTRNGIVYRLDQLVKLFVFTLALLAVGIAIISHLLHDIRVEGL